MKASGKMSVERFEKEFEKEFGVRIEIKKGGRLADNKARLASLRPADYKGPKSSNFEVSGRMHVANLKSKIDELFGVQADLYVGRRIAPDDVSLAAVRRGEVNFDKRDNSAASDQEEIEANISSVENSSVAFFQKLDEVVTGSEPLVEKIRTVSALGREHIDWNQTELLAKKSQNSNLMTGDTLYHEYSEGYIERLKTLHGTADSFEELALLFDEFRPMDKYDKGYDEESLEEVVQDLNQVEIPEDLPLEDLYYSYLGHVNEEYYQVDPMFLSQYPGIILDKYEAEEIAMLFDEGQGYILKACSDEQRDDFYQILMEEYGQEEFDEFYAHFFEDEEEEY
mgnify:CR=1 FL=1